MGQFGLGQSILRTEDQRFLTGTGKFTDDINLAGQAHACFVRSPIASGTINSIDLEDALQSPGVLKIITGDDIKAAGLGTMPNKFPLKQANGSPLVEPPRSVLAQGVVRHVGDPVCMVIAETLAQAQDAAGLVYVDYDEHAAVTSTANAADPGQPQVWDQAPNNTCFDWEMGDRAAVDDAIAKAAHVVDLTLINNRIIVNSMEPRNAIGAFEDGRYVLYTTSQGPHNLKNQLAENIFNVDPAQVRVVTPDVGGGFGMKIFLYPEQPLVCFAAKELGRPVKWNAERSADGFVSDDQGRDHVSKIKLAMDSEYRFLGLKVHTTANLGAYLSNFAPFIPTFAGSQMLAAVYTTPHIHVEVKGVFTNTVPVDAYRGAGRPEAAYLVERTIDKAARELGVDVAEIRRRNFIPEDQMPYTTALEATYDSGKFQRNMEVAIERADRDGFAERRTSSANDGKLRGLGLAYYIEACGAGGGETATLDVDNSGHVTVLIGSQNNGQGHETTYKQIVAARLGIHINDVTIVQGDSDIVLTGSGTGGSRATSEGGTATSMASESVLEKGRRIAGHAMETADGDIEYEDGVYTVAGTDRSMSLGEIAKAAMDAANLPEGMEPGLKAAEFFKGPAKTYPNGCHVCELEIDKDTGSVEIKRYTVVDDFGTVINPLTLAGQVHGGIGQGLGQALLESTVYDEESGQLLSGSFMDYTMPRADDMAQVDFTYFEDAPCTAIPLGVKGAGEAGAIGAPPAIINALVDALSDYGVTHIDMPATPQSLWQIINGAGRAE